MQDVCPADTAPILVTYDCGSDDPFACRDVFCVRGWGRLITIASIQGKRGDHGQAAYCSASHGVIGLTRDCGAGARAWAEGGGDRLSWWVAVGPRLG